jgi:phenylacetate-coenzyme A ligase PaaK-like adenylate-forming protein
MVEHGVPYCECEHGNMHVPLYSRVYVRDPGTLEILPHGETGIFHLLTPYLNSFPAPSLLTTDLGRLVERCPCGRNSPYLQIIGRGGVKKHQGCALAALKFLQ